MHGKLLREFRKLQLVSWWMLEQLAAIELLPEKSLLYKALREN